MMITFENILFHEIAKYRFSSHFNDRNDTYSRQNSLTEISSVTKLKLLAMAIDQIRFLLTLVQIVRYIYVQ